jgi:hypothetical protein
VTGQKGRAIEEEKMYPYQPQDLVTDHIREARSQAAAARLRAAVRNSQHRPARHWASTAPVRWMSRRV